MEYEEHFEKFKNFMKKTSFLQRMTAVIVVAVFVGIAVFLINPAKKFAEMRNSQRRADIAVILNAVHEYSIANNGNLPAAITENPTMICAENASSCEGLTDLSVLKESGRYLKKIPSDPTEKSLDSSGYQVSKTTSGRVRIVAPNAERKAAISLSK